MSAGTRPVHLVVMGVAGSGKSTVAQGVSDVTGWRFAEGDAFHPRANVEKMAAGEPLTDADRAPWLARLAEWIAEQEAAGRSTVLSCSALRRRYRDVLRSGAPDVRHVHLTGDRDVLVERLSLRGGHFFPADLLDSQLATLEPLEPDERGLQVALDLDPVDQVHAVQSWLDVDGRPATTSG